MKMIFFGTGLFGSYVLNYLCDAGLLPDIVVTQPDRPKGRGLNVSESAVSTVCVSRALKMYKPEKLDDTACKVLTEINPDIIVLADYGKILNEKILAISNTAIGVHPSLLPAYRGAAPVQRALYSGCVKTGVTIFKIVKEVDAGAICAVSEVVIDDNDTAESLMKKLAVKGAALVVSVVDKLKNGQLTSIEQDHANATYADKFVKSDALIDWSEPARTIVNKVRALNIWPIAETSFNGKRIQIVAAEFVPVDNANVAGVVVAVDKTGIYVSAGIGGHVKILTLKPEGKRQIDAWQFICGYRVKAGDVFGG